MKSERPNFKIVESVPSDVDYEVFKKEFLDPSTRVSDITKKSGMSGAEYRDYRQRVLEEEGIDKKPIDWKLRFRGARHKILNNTTNIQKKDGAYSVKKHINGEHKYYGRYSDLDTAKMVRDKLIECDWDDKVGAELKEKYGNNKTRSVKQRAVEMFPTYEHYYVHRKDLSVEEIIKKMGLTSRVYMHLTSMIKEKYGLPRYKL